MSRFNDIVDLINGQRSAQGFLSIENVLQLQENGNKCIDPFSTLISQSVQIGTGNVFYPNTVVERRKTGNISIGNRNIFYPGTFLLADSGEISIGDENQFGDGNIRIKANYPAAKIIIRSGGRYLENVQILGTSYLGNGAQVLGNITVQDCELADGETYQCMNVDLRGAVLKGFGLAKGICVAQGMVINGTGNFSKDTIQRQSFYHK